MVHRFLYEAILKKNSGFTKQELSRIEEGISTTKSAIQGSRIEKGVIIKAPSRSVFPVAQLEQLLKELEDKRKQILAELSSGSSKGSNGGALTHKRNNNIYKVHIGSRGGKYIVYNGKKVYI